MKNELKTRPRFRILDTTFNDSILFLATGLYLALLFVNLFIDYDLTMFKLYFASGIIGFTFGTVFGRLFFRRFA